MREVTAAVLGAEEGDKAGNPFSGNIPFLVSFGLAAAVFRLFLLGAAEKHGTNKVLYLLAGRV